MTPPDISALIYSSGVCNLSSGSRFFEIETAFRKLAQLLKGEGKLKREIARSVVSAHFKERRLHSAGRLFDAAMEESKERCELGDRSGRA